MTTEIELAVERYFQYLDDPSSLIDQNRVGELQRSIASSTSLMERAKLISELERAESTDASHVEKGFVTHGRRWAETNGVTASALRSVGVPAEVLSAAGFDGRRRGKERAAGRSGRGRGIGTTQVRAHVLNLQTPFTYQQIIAETGSSLMTVRKAVGGLLEDGSVVQVGQDESWDGPGRAPILFRVAG